MQIKATVTRISQLKVEMSRYYDNKKNNKNNNNDCQTKANDCQYEYANEMLTHFSGPECTRGTSDSRSPRRRSNRRSPFPRRKTWISAAPTRPQSATIQIQIRKKKSAPKKKKKIDNNRYHIHID